MKYEPEYYIGSGYYSDMDDEIVNSKEKLVKCRKNHKCATCQGEIKSNDYAVLETGFMDGRPVSCYTCLTCIEKWLEESGQVEFEEREEN